MIEGEDGIRADPGVGWMLRYQSGEEGAFDRLVEEYASRVFALLTRFLGPRENREDIVQEVFLRVIRARAEYRPEARFSTWLYRIAFNLCANENERRRAAFSLDHAPGDFAEGRPDEHSPAPGEALERQDLVRGVRSAIAALPPRQRMALVLAKYEGLSYEEVGKVLGISEKAVKSMVHRARETLRVRLSGVLEEDVA